MDSGGGRARAVVGVSGSPGSLAALHRAVREARRTGAELLAVLAWEPPGGELAHGRAVLAPPVADLRRAAADRLLAVLDAAFGDAGPGSRSRAWPSGVRRAVPWWRPPIAPTIS